MASTSFNSDFYLAMDTVFPVMLLAVGLMTTLIKTVAYVNPVIDGEFVGFEAQLEEKKKRSDRLTRRLSIADGISYVFLGAASLGMVLSTLALLQRFGSPVIKYIVFACFIVVVIVLILALLMTFGKAWNDAFLGGLDSLYGTKKEQEAAVEKIMTAPDSDS
jgi:hypothetical protein